MSMRRAFRVVAFTSALAAAATLPRSASAGGAFVPGASGKALEQRVAVAAGADRVTLWTALRFTSPGGPAGYVVPVPPGASLDYSSDGWFEALEVATAPRVLPPEGEGPYCPGQSGADDPFDMTGEEQHVAGLEPSELQILPDAAAVESWAQQAGLSLSGAALAKLEQAAGMRFAAARFSAPSGEATTKTLRVVMPGAVPTLPLALTSGVGADVLVTTWVLGPGRGALEGAASIVVPLAEVAWGAEQGKSDYDAIRKSLLSDGGSSSAVAEAAGHDVLLIEQPIVGDATIPPAVRLYFDRAENYGDAVGASSCFNVTLALLEADDPVASVCPRADLGVVDGTDTCVEAPAAGEIDPDSLRCGAGADDLAVALSGLAPGAVWLTRYSLLVRDGADGVSFPVEYTAAGAVTPVLVAGQLDTSQCPETAAAAGSGASGPSGGPTGGPSGGDGDGDPDVTVVDAGGCSCSDTSDTYVPEDDGDGAGGDGSGGDGDGDDDGQAEGEGDGCDGESESSSDDGCDCGGTETETVEEEEESSDDGCDCGGTESQSDDGSSSDDCTVAAPSSAKARKRTRARLSPIALAALAVLLPVRRGTRKKRDR